MNQEYIDAREAFDLSYYIIGFILFLIIFWMINRDKKPVKVAEIPEKVFTREEIKKYDGKSNPGKLIYIACNNYVFDVSDSPFY